MLAIVLIMPMITIGIRVSMDDGAVDYCDGVEDEKNEEDNDRSEYGNVAARIAVADYDDGDNNDPVQNGGGNIVVDEDVADALVTSTDVVDKFYW